MDYVILVSILTFFILIYFLNTREAYTDSYINTALGEIKKTMDSVDTTLSDFDKIPKTITITSAQAAIQSALTSYSDNQIGQQTLNSIQKQKNALNIIQGNILTINEYIQKTLESTTTVVTLKTLENKDKMFSLKDSLKQINIDLKTINNKLTSLPD